MHGTNGRVADRDLVIAAMLGDLACFDELARRYRAAVVATARFELGDPDLAADVAQEALLLAYRKLPLLSAPDAFGPWLRVLTLRLARRERRGWRRITARYAPLEAAVLLACPAVRPDGAIERSEVQQAVRTAVVALGEPDATLVTLRYLEGMPLERAGAYVGLTRDGAKWRLKRATARLRQSLQHLESDPSDASDS